MDLYIDCFSGISGDKFIAALVDLGFPLQELNHAIKSTGLKGIEVTSKKRLEHGVLCTLIDIKDESKIRLKEIGDFEKLINKSSISKSAKSKSLKIISAMTKAESRVHGEDANKTHFHEVGNADTLIDSIGAVLGLEYFNVKNVISSPVALGSGKIKSSHGTLPIPAPATAEILSGVPVYQGDVEGELTTPTGAAIIKTFASSFSHMPPFTIKSIGYGCGHNSFNIPNYLRIFLGNLVQSAGFSEKVMLLSTNIDDMNPEILADCVNNLLEAGALDAWIEPVIMKKGRPGFVLNALSDTAKVQMISEIILSQTTTLGLRIQELGRIKLDRKIIEVNLGYATVSLKIGYLEDKILTASPEYESALRASKTSGKPLKDIYDEAKAKWLEQNTKK
ncbi:MAG: nickel pincer cofactor biosynthesis protein LarC [Actinobacteria bacterium]|nr:nickel pincer cofactor biosynthesis protein LarC [Actinomycetota bacterium]